MKILILGSFPAPYRVDVFKGISKKYSTDVFFATDKDQNRSAEYFVGKDEFNYYVLSRENDYAFFKKCVKNLKKYDLVLAYDWYLRCALKVQKKCIKYGIPYIINCDGAFLSPKSNAISYIKDLIKRYFIRNASLCFAGGKSAKEYFMHYGADKSKIVIHPFTSLHKQDILERPLEEREKQQLRIKLGLKKEKLVLAVGQFIERKGFDVLLNAWTDLDSRFQLVVIGGGNEKSKYESIIAKHKYKNVILIDYLSKSEIYQYYMAANVFAMPTYEDVWGLVINEAAANALPIVSTSACNAAMEIIANGVTGKIVEPGNVCGLHDAIKEFLFKTDAECIEIGEKELEIIGKYIIENVIARHLQSIEKVCRK